MTEHLSFSARLHLFGQTLFALLKENAVPYTVADMNKVLKSPMAPLLAQDPARAQE